MQAWHKTADCHMCSRPLPVQGLPYQPKAVLLAFAADAGLHLQALQAHG